jgi:hypothetical protein
MSVQRRSEFTSEVFLYRQTCQDTVVAFDARGRDTMSRRFGPKAPKSKLCHQAGLEVIDLHGRRNGNEQ